MPFSLRDRWQSTRGQNVSQRSEVTPPVVYMLKQVMQQIGQRSQDSARGWQKYYWGNISKSLWVTKCLQLELGSESGIIMKSQKRVRSLIKDEPTLWSWILTSLRGFRLWNNKWGAAPASCLYHVLTSLSCAALCKLMWPLISFSNCGVINFSCLVNQSSFSSCPRDVSQSSLVLLRPVKPTTVTPTLPIRNMLDYRPSQQ